MDDERYAKIAISIPADLLERLERLRASEGRSRSRVIREAVAQYVAAAEQDALAEEIREAYRRMPETDEELAEIDALFRMSAKAWAEDLPWDAPAPEREGE